MRLSRSSRRRKLLYILAVASLGTFVYSQLLSYAIIASTTTTEKSPCAAAAAEPIDVVYTWVNGSEERFRAEMRRHATASSAPLDARAARRFDDKNELRYSLRSVERHMAWARRVYVVTNGQIPAWLDMDCARLTLVTHAEIFERADDDLPTFSSPAIEANLHRIPGLSRRFVYFNDDVFLNADVYPEDFHTRSGGYKIYTAWRMRTTNDSDAQDLYAASLIYTQKLLGARFGYARRDVVAHAPLMIDAAIMREVQRAYPDEFAATVRSRFRREDNLQIGFVYSYYMALIKERKSLEEIFDEFDTDNSGTWSDREIHTLLTRLYTLPLKMETVLEFQSVLNNCTNSLDAAMLEEEFKRKAPRYERYVDSSLNLITRKMLINCRMLEDVLHDKVNVTMRPKYRHEFVQAAEHVSFNQLHSLASASMEALDSIRRTPKKFVCVNDDLDETNATRGENALSASLLEDLFMSLFPARSSFELPEEYRNKFARVEELRAWQEWRWREPEHPWFRAVVLAAFACLLLLCLQLRLAWVRRLK